ncbi:hypothetical protein D3C73_1152060 [compost metagenome]
MVFQPSVVGHLVSQVALFVHVQVVSRSFSLSSRDVVFLSGVQPVVFTPSRMDLYALVVERINRDHFVQYWLVSQQRIQ